MSPSVRTQIETSAAPPATGAYSQAIRAGNLVFVAGQLGADPTTGELADGVAAQAERVLLNLSAVLDAAGTSLDRVVKTTVFLSDMIGGNVVDQLHHVPASTSTARTMYSSTVTSVRRSKLMSRNCPSHRARQVSS